MYYTKISFVYVKGSLVKVVEIKVDQYYWRVNMGKLKYLIITLTITSLTFVIPAFAVEELISRSFLFSRLNETFMPLNLQLSIMNNEAKVIEENIKQVEDKINSLLPSFQDVNFSHWAANDIYFLVSKGVVSGFSKTEFKPNEYVTRAQLAIMLVRAKNLPLIDIDPGFSDVKPGQLEYKFIATAKNAGIINGYLDGTFKPNHRITRGQMAKMMVDAFDLKSNEKEMPFNDVSQSYLFAEWIKHIAYTGVSTGFGNGIFKPEENTTRAQVSAFIARAIDPVRRVPLKEVGR